MKSINWYRRRKESRRTGSYRQADADKIKLNMSRVDIELFCDELKLKEIFNGNSYRTDFTIEHIKGAVYLGNIPNNEEAIKNELCRYNEDLEKSFPKLFWNEYLYNDRAYWDYKELNKFVRLANKVKKILDLHPEFQGLTGEELQEDNNRILAGVEMDFSWRAWGSLMAAYMNTKEKKRKYHYMNYYM